MTWASAIEISAVTASAASYHRARGTGSRRAISEQARTPQASATGKAAA